MIITECPYLDKNCGSHAQCIKCRKGIKTMTTFRSLKDAETFAEVLKEEHEIDYIMIMKKGEEFAVTTDYKAGTISGFESYISIF